MAETRVRKATELLIAALKKRRIKANKIFLFGSASRSKVYNDIDFLVVSPSLRNKSLFKRSEITGDITYDIIKEIHFPVDIIVKTPEEFQSGRSLICHYAAQGKLVYSD